MQVKLFPDDSKSSKEPQVMSEWRKTQKSAYKQARSVPFRISKVISAPWDWRRTQVKLCSECLQSLPCPGTAMLRVKLCSDKRNGSNPVEKDSNLSEHSLL